MCGRVVGAGQEDRSHCNAERQERAMIGPTTSRTACGATMPTKLTTPAAATLAPTAIATRNTIAAFSRSRRTPRWKASASPSASAFSPRDRNGAAASIRRYRRQRGDFEPVRAAERAHRPEGQIAQLSIVAHISENANERTRQRQARRLPAAWSQPTCGRRASRRHRASRSRPGRR
jgi:hypothetical protein